MSDESAFLAALRANPDDDAARLVFADWLDERGDPRAAWVRNAEIWRHAGPDFNDPIPGLAGSLGSAQRRQRITDALVSLGPAVVPAVVAAMRTEDDDVRHHART